MLPHLPPDQQKELLVHMNQNKLEPIADYMELGRVMGERTLLLIQYRGGHHLQLPHRGEVYRQQFANVYVGAQLQK